ncbi:unnamed protein product (macronuclear) [Paramecium tetraurelia]|uniref:Uncharacterized protein n=1 Tax=Paramecium tetraurelia TaxID=5888 RepID=A0EDI1_PARTE|nr:uncharacterized protein GSPATT00004217001 [Paramecium tetraurelia]CAK93348.1 unnamed protein product [Paramecium tetraurelia]|eukprot:XP_001460745.1 hypothetical protein (macronuclear) [Paramecium tetraurelia strain d4-2]
MQQQQKQPINERRRRSGALHAQTCEEYLKKYEQIGQIVIRESSRKKSLSESAFLNFDFIPADEGVEDICQLKILIYSPKIKLNEQEFLQILKRVRNRSITTDNLPFANKTFDFDFFYREYDVNDKHFGLHFWIQNNPKHKHNLFFTENYYRFFNAAILLQRDQNIESLIRETNPNCMIKIFPFMDELLLESLQSIIAEICHSNIKS